MQLRNRLRSAKGTKVSPLDNNKLSDFEKLVAELEKNFKKSDRLVKEIRKLVRRKK